MQKIVSFLTAIVMTLSGFFFPGSSGQIYLLGESHGYSSIMAVELETWDRYYQQECGICSLNGPTTMRNS